MAIYVLMPLRSWKSKMISASNVKASFEYERQKKRLIMVSFSTYIFSKLTLSIIRWLHRMTPTVLEELRRLLSLTTK